MSNLDYKAAYERQTKAREMAEEQLENRSRELYDLNQNLMSALNKLKDQKTQLVHNEKLAGIGQLAAGIAHEINNPSAYVKSNVNSLKRYIESLGSAFQEFESILTTCVGDGKCDTSLLEERNAIYKRHDIEFVLGDLDDTINDTMEGLDRIEDIVTSLKDFSRPDQIEPVHFNINDCIENTIKVAWNQIKYKCKLQKNLSPVPDLRGQPGSMGQVFLNLLINASHAIEDFGDIVIDTAVKDNNIEISIQDTGCGIDPGDTLKIFDPFFTTKPDGKGTGLGLSISNTIVKKHGGRMAVESQPGEGTCFKIFLPVLDAHADSPGNQLTAQ